MLEGTGDPSPALHVGPSVLYASAYLSAGLCGPLQNVPGWVLSAWARPCPAAGSCVPQ